MTLSPYEVEGFYDRALENGKHRDIVGGRWDETGRVQMQILRDMGLQPDDVLLDIGAGSLRLGCKAIEYLEPGHYWATDASRALMLRGREVELVDPSRLSEAQLIEDKTFDFVGVSDDVTHAICFAVFTHLPISHLARALKNLRRAFPKLGQFAFTVFLAPDHEALGKPYRQKDGVVTHPARAPYHFLAEDVLATAQEAGWEISADPMMLPRGQALYLGRICQKDES